MFLEEDSPKSTEESSYVMSQVERVLPSINTMLPSSKTQVSILELVSRVRFRYSSEFRRYSAFHSLNQRKSFGKIEIANYVGNVYIIIDLVYGSSGERHDNELYLMSKAEGYSDDGNGRVLFKGVQLQNVKIYELPLMGVIRATSSSIHRRVRPHETDRVNFRFRFQLSDCLPVELISAAVVDSKCLDRNAALILVHMNPKKTLYNRMIESTLLCDGVSSKCRVVFESADGRFHREAAVILCHKKVAMVVSVPSFPDPAGGEVLVKLIDTDGNVSNSHNFVYAPDYAVLSTPKRESTRQRLRTALLTRRIMHDAPTMPGECNVSDLAFIMAEGDIAPDKSLVKHLASSPLAMLERNQDALTPLAEALLCGNVEIAEAFLNAMPEPLATQVLQQRMTDAHMTHLHLTVSAGSEPPLSLLTLLVKAGCDPMACDTDGNSLLHLLILVGNHEALLEQLLEAAKADESLAWGLLLLNRLNTAGFGPLHEAVQHGQQRAVEALVAAGADPNLSTRCSHLTALHYAVLDERSVDLIRALLNAPSLEINAQTLGRKTALDIALEKENKELIALLEEKGAASLYAATSDEDEEEEEEEEEEKNEGTEEADNKKEETAGAVNPAQTSVEESVTWEEVKEALQNDLTRDDFRHLGRAVLSASQAALLERTSSPDSFFFRLFKADSAEMLMAPLRAMGRTHLADLVANADIT